LQNATKQFEIVSDYVHSITSDDNIIGAIAQRCVENSNGFMQQL